MPMTFENPEASPVKFDEEVPPDLNTRILCSDGACVGVIGDHDRCNECGALYVVEDPSYQATLPSSSSAIAPEFIAPDRNHDAMTMTQDDADTNLENRILCIDGACIGVIGSDGCCRECGKPYAPEEAGAS